MTFASPSIAYTTTPRDALFQAHQRASTAMAVYLIGGGACTVAALLAWSWHLQSPWEGVWQMLPMVMTLVAVLWIAIGAWVQHRIHAQVQKHDQLYREVAERNHSTSSAQRHTAARVNAVPSDAPWELLAFFNAPATHPPAHRTVAPSAAHTRSALQAAQPQNDDAQLAVQGKPLRPISLFGAYDAS